MLSFLDKISSVFISHPAEITTAPASTQNARVKAQTSPDFSILTDQGFWNGDPRFVDTAPLITSKQLFARPLVVAFFSAEWQEYGFEQLDKLHLVQQQIKALGGHLLVVTDATLRELRSLVKKNDINLNIYSDPENFIAEQFGVYDAENPVYNRISGIEKNVPLLSTFVINPSKKVVYRHINQLQNNDGLSVAKVLEAVQHSEKLN